MSSKQPKITPAFKRKVKRDWHEQIPSLLPDPRHFFISRLVGPLLISVDFYTKTFDNDYYPGFSAGALLIPREVLGRTLSHDLRKSRINIAGEKLTYQDSLSVRQHEKGDYIDAARRMEEQALLPLEGSVSVSQVWQAYQDHYACETSFLTIDLAQDPALVAAWAGRPDIAQQALDWGYEVYKVWYDLRGISESDEAPEEWLKTMQAHIADPEMLRRGTAEMIKLRKLEYLPQEELIPE